MLDRMNLMRTRIIGHLIAQLAALAPLRQIFATSTLNSFVTAHYVTQIVEHPLLGLLGLMRGSTRSEYPLS